MPSRRIVAALLAALAVPASCTSDEPSAVPGIERSSAAPTTTESPPDIEPAPFQTLPPVGEYAYPKGPNDIVVQISVDDQGLAIPLLTVYGGLTVVASTEASWRTGTITDFDVQEFLADAASVGLLDEPLSLRGPDRQAAAQITMRLDVDGTALTHEFDLSAIERPPALRRFLQQAASSNPFGLNEPYDPGSWITCEPASSSPGCSVVDDQLTERDRPVLPHEPDPVALLP